MALSLFYPNQAFYERGAIMMPEFRRRYKDSVLEHMETLIYQIENEMMKYIIICLIVYFTSIILLVM